MSGPRLYLLLAAALAAMVGAIAANAEPAAPVVVRWTARTSLALFALVYVARPATQLWPSPFTRGLLARRKWLGLAFATSHTFHLAGILALAWPDVDGFFAARPPNPLGVASYVLLAAMSVTSIERVKQAMSHRAWRALHLAGLHVAWVVFAGLYARRVAADRTAYVLPLTLLIALAAIRAAAWLRKRLRLARRRAEVTL